jgi:hypothetical protein
MKLFLNIIIIFFSLSLSAQVDSLMYKREVQLKKYLNALRAATTLEEKEKTNQIFKDYLAETIQLNGAFDYPFSELKTLGSIKSPDNSFRLFNWNVEQEERTNKYYCYVLRFDEKKKEWKTIELIDNSASLPKKPNDVLDENNWYGALYYKIIPFEKGNKTLYTVLGWDGHSRMSNMKLIDVISFSGNHVKLGSPIFKTAEGVQKRLFFEHSNKAFMSLNYDEARKRIIFDHLSPETPSMAGMYEYYVPDMSYDQMVIDGKKWIVQEDVVGVNNKDSKSYTLQYINKKNNKVAKANVKNTWNDPSDPNAPGGANVHVAKLPGDEIEKTKNKDTVSPNQAPKITKKQKRNSEFSMNPFLKNKSKK